MSPAAGRAGRRQALFLLYQWDLTGQPLASLYEGEPDAFARSLAEAVAARATALDRRITGRPDWPADRLGTLERNILRSASTSSRRGACRARWRSTRRSCWRSGMRPTMRRGS